MGRVLKFYRTADGKCPVTEFLDSLSSKWAKKVTWVLKLIEELEIVPENISRSLLILTTYGNAGFSSVRIL